MISPTASPAITGSIPDFSSATHTATPTTAATRKRHSGGAKRSANSVRNSPAATASGTTLMCSVYAVAITISATKSSITASVSSRTRRRVARGGEEPERAERERGVGRHRRAPAARAVAARVERQEDRDRHRHAAERGGHGDPDPPPLAQLAQVELALGLEPDDEEVERHQALVDPLAQLVRDARAADPDRELGRPHRLVGVRPRRVRPHERGDGRRSSSAAAPALSVLRKSRTGAARLRAHAVRPLGRPTIS